jgi:hypothetical protein
MSMPMGEHPIELSGEGIMRQAKMTAHDYLPAGTTNIDELFGLGTARAHPELVAAYAQIAAIDAGAAIIAQQVRATKTEDGTRGSTIETHRRAVQPAQEGAHRSRHRSFSRQQPRANVCNLARISAQ